MNGLDFTDAAKRADAAASIIHDFIYGRNGVTKQEASEMVWAIHDSLRPFIPLADRADAPDLAKLAGAVPVAGAAPVGGDRPGLEDHALHVRRGRGERRGGFRVSYGTGGATHTMPRTDLRGLPLAQYLHDHCSLLALVSLYDNDAESRPVVSLALAVRLHDFERTTGCVSGWEDV